TDDEWGAVEVQGVRFTLADHDGLIRAAYVADPERLAGRLTRLIAFDRADHFQLTEWVGQVDQCILARPGEADFIGSNVDLAIFQQQIPSGTVTTDLFPKAWEQDVGKTLPIIFGNVARHRLLYIRDDVVNSLFDYLVARGIVEIVALYQLGPNDNLELV